MIRWDDKGNLFDENIRLLTSREIFTREFRKTGRWERGLPEDDVQEFLEQVSEDYQRVVSAMFSYADENDRLKRGGGGHVRLAARDVIREHLLRAQREAESRVRAGSQTAAAIIGDAWSERRKVLEEAKTRAKAIAEAADQRGDEAASKSMSDPAPEGTTAELVAEVSRLRAAGARLRAIADFYYGNVISFAQTNIQLAEDARRKLETTVLDAQADPAEESRSA